MTSDIIKIKRASNIIKRVILGAKYEQFIL